MGTIIRLTDRTRTTTDWTCKRERFYAYDFGGTGLVRRGNVVALDYGTNMHEGLEELAKRVGESDVVGDIAPRIFKKVFEREIAFQGEAAAKELACVAEGSFRGFYETVWLPILRDFDVVAVEAECLKRLTPWLSFMARPDLILRNKLTKQLIYWEYKSFGQQVESWLSQWAKAVQVHSACEAATETLGEPVEDCIIQGLYKGYYKEGHYRSVFSEGWRNLSGIDVVYAYTYMRAKGWERFCPADLDGGIADWVQGMPKDLLSKQFARTPTIHLRTDLSQRFFSQLVERESEIEAAIRLLAKCDHDDDAIKILDKYFPQTFAECSGRFGKYDCSFLEACWNPRIGSDPLSHYARRIPHHAPEEALFKEKGLPV